jgi:hypothetical protein
VLRKLLPASGPRAMAKPEDGMIALKKGSSRIAQKLAFACDSLHRKAIASRQRPIRATLIVVAFVLAILGLARLVAGQEVLYEVYSPVVTSWDRSTEQVVTAYSPIVAYSPVTTVVRAGGAVYEPVTTYRPVTAYEPVTTTTYTPETVYEPMTTTAYRPVTVSAPVTTYRPVTSYLPTTTYSPVVTYGIPTVVAPAYVPTVVVRPAFVPGEPVRNVLRALW